MLRSFIICITLFSVGAFAGDVSTDICTECEQIVGTVHLLLSNNETEGEVLSAMQQICTMLPTEFKSEVSLSLLSSCICNSSVAIHRMSSTYLWRAIFLV